MSKTTDKLIDDIIELIIGDMCCHHEEDRDEDGVHLSVEYSLNNETKLRGMIGELIDKAMEELFEIKVQEYERGLKDAKPAVDEGFINTWANDFATATLHDKEMHKRIIYMLKEAGVEVVKSD